MLAAGSSHAARVNESASLLGLEQHVTQIHTAGHTVRHAPQHKTTGRMRMALLGERGALRCRSVYGSVISST
jgi:hypothetical protein